jgi:hypothetical protein
VLKHQETIVKGLVYRAFRQDAENAAHVGKTLRP